MRKRPIPRGIGLVVVVLMILGLALAAGTIAISTRVTLDERNTLETQAKLKRLAAVVSSTNLPTPQATLRHYEQDVGALPSALDDLITRPNAVSACSMNPSTQELGGWCGPYWSGTYSGESLWTDAWGNALTYSSGSRHIRSRGPDGTDNAGGGDDLVQSF